MQGNKYLLIQNVPSWNIERLYDLDLSFIQFNKKAEIWQSLNQKEDSVQKKYFLRQKLSVSKREEA